MSDYLLPEPEIITVTFNDSAEAQVNIEEPPVINKEDQIKDDKAQIAKLKAKIEELSQQCLQLDSEVTRLQAESRNKRNKQRYSPNILDIPPAIAEPPRGIGSRAPRWPEGYTPPNKSKAIEGIQPFIGQVQLAPPKLSIDNAALQRLTDKEPPRELERAHSREFLQPIERVQVSTRPNPPEGIGLTQSRPPRRVMLLGLCTTLDVAQVPTDEFNAFRRRLERVLLRTTSEETMNYHPQTTDRTPPYSFFTKEFQLQVLDAFADFGLDISDRVGVRGAVKVAGEREIIVSDADVDALLWMNSLLEDITLDQVSRREIILSANNMRWRMIGQPLTPVVMREYIWQTLNSTILYLEGRHLLNRG